MSMTIYLILKQGSLSQQDTKKGSIKKRQVRNYILQYKETS